MNDQEATNGERLHKFIARCGLCSRRKAEELILQGRVSVNGDVVTQLGVKVSPYDEVQVDGEELRPAKLYYLVMNKPLGVVTTLDDPQKRPTVKRFLPDVGVQLKPVGRLDMDSEGLLVFTNDGELAARLTHPRHKIEKEYDVVARGLLDEKDAEKLRKGVFLEGRKTAPAKVEIVHTGRKGDSTRLRMTIHEGRNRQIRKMLELLGHPVVSLKRVRIGPIIMRDMRPGMCKMLSKVEVDRLKAAAGMSE